LGLWPDATPFAVDDGDASSVLDEIVRGPSAALTAVALVAGPRARASGWAARAAMEVAGQWRGSRPVVLADLDLERPSLHALAGVANDEGVIELIEFGLSLAAVRRRADGRGFDVVPAGVYAPDTGAVLRDAAWTRVLLDVAVQRHTLLAYVPADADGADAVVERAGAVLVLAETGEADAVVRGLAHPYAVMAILVPADVVSDEADEPVVIAAAADDVMSDEADEPVVIAAAADDVMSDEADEPVVIAAAADDVVSDAPEPSIEPHVEAPVDFPVDAPVDAPAPAPDEVVDAGSRVRRLSDDEFDAIRLPKERESRDALIADLRHRQRDARMAPPPPRSQWGASGREAGADPGSGPPPPVLLPGGESEHAREMRLEAAADGVSLETLEPRAPVRPAKRSGYRRPLAWTLFVVLMLSLLAGAWRYMAGRMGWHIPFGAGTPPAATAPPALPPEPQPAPQVTDVALPYAVAMEAHVDVATAANRIDVLRAGEHGIPFHVAPLEREGTLYYHVMAGPVADSLTAVALRDSLLAWRLKRAATPGDIRHAPLAFLIGDYGARHVAEQTVTELRQLDIPAYMLLADAEDGEPLYRVYVGGFATPVEAEVTQQLLRAVGVRDSLVTRTGSIVQ
jgi:hypothetical protein